MATTSPPSTANPNGLPDPEALRDVLKAQALEEAIVEAEPSLRYVQFNAQWDETTEMARIAT